MRRLDIVTWSSCCRIHRPLAQFAFLTDNEIPMVWLETGRTVRTTRAPRSAVAVQNAAVQMDEVRIPTRPVAWERPYRSGTTGVAGKQRCFAEQALTWCGHDFQNIWLRLSKVSPKTATIFISIHNLQSPVELLSTLQSHQESRHQSSGCNCFDLNVAIDSPIDNS
jgi:hypothetical protein